MNIRFIVASIFIISFVSQTTMLSAPELISVGLFVYFFLDLIENFGKQIVILHFFIVLAIIQWLIMPILAYHIYNQSNYLAVLWVKTMEVPAEKYFEYVLPGTIAMILGFRFPLKYPPSYKNPLAYIKRTQNYLIGKSKIGWNLIGLGLVTSSIGFFVPAGLGNVIFLFGALVYCGILYLFYSDYKNKWVPLGILFLMEAVNALKSGMFGGSLFVLITFFIILSLQWNLKFITKFSAIAIGFFFILVLQSVKAEYRAATWSGANDSKASTFGTLVAQKIDSKDAIVNQDNLFFLVMRFNNGWQISRTMDRVPARIPYGNGETIFLSLAATAVPRVLWADKPQTGGKFNLERYWGISYGRTAMNISPLGEGYANFGVFGGIIFMFLFGLLLNWCIERMMNWVEKRPTIICWFPLIFYSFYGVETDLLSILNALFKGVVFTYFFLRLYRYISKIRI
jgi:hypothetical protein